MEKKQTRLSAKAMDDLRAIVKEEIIEPMTDEEIEEMGIGLLQLFYILLAPEPTRSEVQPTEQEQRALDYIEAERVVGREPTVRGMAQAAGFKSSRSGKKLRDSMIAKGFIKEAR